MGLKTLEVEVVLDAAAQLRRVRVQLGEGATVADAVRASGLLAEPIDALRLGIFGRLRAPGDAVQDGDRVEIYRGLLADPKAARRQRAARRESIRDVARPG